MARERNTAGAEAGALVKARVIGAGQYGQIDDVVEVSAAEAEASSDLDAHADAVAYAESLKADQA
jgi:hypothetical protein